MRAAAGRLLVLAASAGLCLPAGPLPAAEPARIDVLPPPVLYAMQGVVSVGVREFRKMPVFRGGRFHWEEIRGRGAGSGVVVTEDGLILTNAHVVEGSAEVRVGLASGRDIEAVVVSTDRASDLALLRAEGVSARPVAISDAGLPPSGERVYVVGNRGDRGLQVSWARVGAHRRVRVGARPLEFWCEVEGLLGPGNSGGVVLDAGGRLVGIPGLQVHYADGATRRSSGLFIPSDHVRRSLRRMLESPAPAWPWIGLVLEDPLLATSTGRRWDGSAGARIRSIVPGGPSDGAGFAPGDLIVSVGPRPVRDNFEALGAVLDLVPDREIDLVVRRGDRLLRVRVTPGVRPPDPRPDALDDFALHTGLRLTLESVHGRKDRLVFAGMSGEARRSMPGFEAELFADTPTLRSIIPGQDALAGRPRRRPVRSIDDLASLLRRCFVEEQFVALAHWSDDGRASVDRAHVHRKVYPLVL